ncbi:MAG TPA: hypothetical protein VI142_08240 [Gaiellaceae bacterium]
MSYLTQYAVARPSSRKGARVDEHTVLNFPDFDGGAHVRAFVEDTSGRKVRRRRLPSPRLKLRITDCTNQIHLEFSVDSPELRENSLHKINTLIAALERFQAGLSDEAQLRALREKPKKEACNVVPEPHSNTARAAVRADSRLGPGAERRRGLRLVGR